MCACLEQVLSKDIHWMEGNDGKMRLFGLDEVKCSNVGGQFAGSVLHTRVER